jgi:diadenosine tetraphosphate (Ap4A) HIT family hydrolase
MTVWDELAAGNNCSFDAPRAAHTADWDAVATLRAATLYLRHNQTYRGHCVLVFDPRHATRLDQLSPSEWRAFSEDLHAAARAVTAVCAPDHVNVASLGNLMPHLHWHIVPRYKSDPQWGRPVWTADLAETDTRLPAAERAALLAALQGELGPQRRD